MLGVPGAKWMACLDRSCRDESVGDLNTMCQGVLFDEGGGHRTDCFRKGQYSELESAERLLDLPHLQLRSGALDKFHQ